jgi:hypothetical protein
LSSTVTKTSRRHRPWSSKADQTVRFQEHFQVIAPPLRSTWESREAGAYFIFIVLFPGLVARLFLRHRHCQLLRESVLAIFIEFEPDSDDLDDDAVALANLENAI